MRIPPTETNWIRTKRRSSHKRKPGANIGILPESGRRGSACCPGMACDGPTARFWRGGHAHFGADALLALPYAFFSLPSFIVDHTHHSSDPAVADLRGGFTSTRFVLVEPSHPGNVGAAARALKTMGFSRLVLVSPRVPHVQSDPEAIAMASGADDVLASAHVVPTLADALSGVHWSIALTARLREYGPPQWTPRAAAGAAREQAIHGEIGRASCRERV